MIATCLDGMAWEFPMPTPDRTLLSILLPLLLARLAQAQERRRPNVLFLFADDQRVVHDFSGRGRKPDRHQPEWMAKKYFGE